MSEFSSLAEMCLDRTPTPDITAGAATQIIGRLEYHSCPFSTQEPLDVAHRERVRCAYRVALGYYVRPWLLELVNTHGWTCQALDKEIAKGSELGEDDKARTLMISPDGKQTLMIPHTAAQFLSADAEFYYKEMFGKFEVKSEVATKVIPGTDGRPILPPDVINAPEPVSNIIFLLQCVLPGQLFMVADRITDALGFTAVEHLSAYPSREWCLTHWDKVVSVTIPRLALSGSHSETIFGASKAIREFTVRHGFIDLRGRRCTIDQIQFWHPLPFRYSPSDFPGRSTTPEPESIVGRAKRGRDEDNGYSNESPVCKRARSESVPYLSSGETVSPSCSPKTPLSDIPPKVSLPSSQVSLQKGGHCDASQSLIRHRQSVVWVDRPGQLPLQTGISIMGTTRLLPHQGLRL